MSLFGDIILGSWFQNQEKMQIHKMYVTLYKPEAWLCTNERLNLYSTMISSSICNSTWLLIRNPNKESNVTKWLSFFFSLTISSTLALHALLFLNLQTIMDTVLVLLITNNTVFYTFKKKKKSWWEKFETSSRIL